MKKNVLIYSILALVLILGACSNKADSTGGSVSDGEAVGGYGSIDHGVENGGKVGFNMLGGSIEEATNVPAAEKELIMKSFDTYMHAFNNQDIDEYMSVLSKNPKSFTIEEERDYIEGVFKEYELGREASDVTVVKFDEDANEAQVFANLYTTMKQKSTGLETKRDGRQVTVFSKEDGEWKVTSVYYMEDQK
ncbi:nuclear transport factor 2 family protein [Sporosarcina highlanderae]|uniref:Nuclear transport factor 2 family protein n=1 Tax=Sporosarcina highlanderae TaxID=3035916 RepID=A0ABT8JNP2_9BACL|nr:nuclear transport factor 2 family protein [Sporosarcina highlanderae]MDN4606760.1 nuclear transport factor 2 family protein [Sporosarcina highlanderae]